MYTSIDTSPTEYIRAKSLIAYGQLALYNADIGGFKGKIAHFSRNMRDRGKTVRYSMLDFKTMLYKLLGWVASKTWMRNLAELGDIVGPLIQAEELIKYEIVLPSQYKVRYEQLRSRISDCYGVDIVEDIANSEVFGGMTVSQHAKAVFKAYLEKSDIGRDALLDELTKESIAASERAYALYIK